MKFSIKMKTAGLMLLCIPKLFAQQGIEWAKKEECWDLVKTH